MPYLRTKGLSAAVVTGLIYLSAVATSAEDLTIERAVSIALERSSDLRRLENQVDLNQTAVEQGRARFQPDLNLSISPSERFGRTFDQRIGQVKTQRSESLSLNASSRINLFNGYADQAALAAARLDLQAGQQDLARARQRIAYSAAAQFLSIFSAEELIAVERENIAAQRQQLDRIQAYWEQGTRSRADVLQQQATLAAAELRLLNAEQRHQLAELRLKETLQVDLASDLTFSGPSLTDLQTKDLNYTPEPLIQDALELRHDLTGQQLRIAAAQEQIRQARAGLLPQVNLSINTGTNYSSLNERDGFGDQLTDLNPSASIGLNLSLPIFDRALTKSQVARSQVQLKNQKIILEDLQRGITFELHQTLLDYRTALKRQAVAAARETAAAEALAAMEARYDSGSATFVELSQTRAQHVDAKGSWVEALYDVTLAQLAIEYNRGGEAWQAALQQMNY